MSAKQGVFKCVAIFAVIVVAAHSRRGNAECRTEQQDTFQVVRLTDQLTGIVFNTRIKLWLDADAAGNVTHADWGTVIDHVTDDLSPGPESCNSGRVNCVNVDYAWQEVDINTEWEVWMQYGLSFHFVTQADGVAFWDYVYSERGYVRLGSTLDYSRNCHGHAIGSGAWPHDDMYGAGIIINTNVCHLESESYEIDSKFATAEGFGHSIAVTVEEWEDEYTGGLMIAETSEKWGSSPVYTRTANASNFLVAEIPPVAQSEFGGGAPSSFKYYSVKTSP